MDIIASGVPSQREIRSELATPYPNAAHRNFSLICTFRLSPFYVARLHITRIIFFSAAHAAPLRISFSLKLAYELVVLLFRVHLFPLSSLRHILRSDYLFEDIFLVSLIQLASQLLR